MLKTKLVLMPVFILLLLVAPVNVEAAGTKQEVLDKLLEQIENLQLLIKDRFDFNRTTLIVEVDENRSSDFFLRLAGESAPIIYIEKNVDIILETDGGVRQILITVDCRDTKSGLVFYNNATCQEQTWITEAELKNGVKTFNLPVRVLTTEDAGEVDLTIFACRFDGCVLETELELPFKNNIEFSDLVKIYDRYEWVYEWDDDFYHVQEVLLSFPFKDVKKVNLRVRCDERNLSITTTEKNRATCNSRRRYSNVYYRDSEVDEQGNVYNLRIESVTRDSEDYVSGAVEMEFEFVGHKNSIITTLYHRPLQKEEVLEETEE